MIDCAGLVQVRKRKRVDDPCWGESTVVLLLCEPSRFSTIYKHSAKRVVWDDSFLFAKPSLDNNASYGLQHRTNVRRNTENVLDIHCQPTLDFLDDEGARQE